ncbi:MAG: LacI family DNA-binding transcriptional regulator [Actinomycetaceae bacterium]|nr:LacI family DNA-binding transcriptional regulator [Actinomycetaceae bacterium]
MADVARLAGVSAQTVSRVLSGKGPVRESTRQRVLAAVEQLRYSPDPAAQMLASGQSRVIGVLMAGHMSYGRMRSYTAFERVQRLRRHFVVSATANPQDANDVLQALDYLQGLNVRAIVVMGQRTEVVYALLSHLNQPTVVAINAEIPSAPVSRVEVDQSIGMIGLLDHLRERGCRNIVQVMPDNEDVDAIVRRRLYTTYCEENDLPVRVIPVANWGCADGEAAGEVLASAPHFDAVMAGNDNIAIGIASVLGNRRNLIAGRDYALTGFDDIEVAAYQRPGLTTVHQDYGELADAISDEIEHLLTTGENRLMTLHTHVVVRGSTSEFTPKAHA